MDLVSKIRSTPLLAEPPIPLRIIKDVPEFPIETLPEWARTWCEEYARIKEQPVALAASTVLALYAAIFQGSHRITVRDSWTNEPLCLWIASLASSGAGKTMIVNAATKQLQLEMEELEQDYIKQKNISDATIESLKRGKADISREMRSADPERQPVLRQQLEDIVEEMQIAEAQRPRHPDWTVDNPTPQAFRGIWYSTGGLSACFASESIMLNTIIGNRYEASSDADGTDVLRKAWDGDRNKVERASQETVSWTGRTYLTMLQMVQPDVLGMFQRNTGAQERGTFQRFLWFWPEVVEAGDRHFPRDEPSSDVRREFDTHVHKAYQNFRLAMDIGGVVLRMNPSAYDYIQDINVEMEPFRAGEDELLVTADNKLYGGQMIRVAAVLHMMDTDGDPGDEIPMDCVYRARKIIDCSREHLRKAIAGMRDHEKTNDAELIVDYISKRYPGELHLRYSEIKSAFKRNRKWDVKRTKAAVTLLEEHLFVCKYKKEGVEMLKLSPAIHDYSAS